MSNTSGAFDNVRILRSGTDRGRLRTWLLKAAEHLPRDIVLAPHIEVHVTGDSVLALQCERCGKARCVEHVAQAADFRDRHYHCGEFHAPAWRCGRCDNWAFAFETRCRFCNEDRSVPVATADIPPGQLLDQYVLYTVFLPGRQWRADILCNSLLRAQRAARAMYRGDEAEVRTAFGSWCAGGE